MSGSSWVGGLSLSQHSLPVVRLGDEQRGVAAFAGAQAAPEMG